MTLRAKASRLFFLTAIGLALLAGCARDGGLEILQEEEDPVFRRARDLYARGMENEALENFLKLIQKRNGNAPESHLDAGNIYLKHLRDPVSAIYHFKHYEALIQRSGLPDADTRIDLVEERIKAAKKEFALSFDAKVYKDPLERLKLLDTIEALRSENELLKGQLTEARTKLNAFTQNSQPRSMPEEVQERPQRILAAETTQSPPARTSAPQPTNQRTYTIQAGDSLYKIARQAYGDASRWKEILNANRDLIPDEGNLRVGTTIRIP